MPAVEGREGIVFRRLEPAAPVLDFAVVYREDLSAEGLQDFLRTARAAVRAPA